jgi:CHAD domain-containing protein
MASPADSRSLANTLARKLLNRLASQGNRTLTSTGASEVHDLRVAIRRFIQVLLVFKPCFPAKEVKRIHRALKRVMTLAGEVRDLDIAVSLLRQSRQADAVVLRSKFQKERKEAARILAGKLKRWMKRRTCSKWRHQLLVTSADPRASAPASVEDAANEILPRLVKRFVALGEHAARGTDDLEQLHQLRITAKKIRYTLELVAPLHESDLGNRLQQLKSLQEVLGNINDIEIVRIMVSKEDDSSKLCSDLTRKRDKKIEEFFSSWQMGFARAEELMHWRKDLTGFLRKRSIPRKPPLRSESTVSLVRGPLAAQ